MNSHPVIPSANFVPLKSPLGQLFLWPIGGLKRKEGKKNLKREKYVWRKEHGKVKVRMECFEERLI